LKSDFREFDVSDILSFLRVEPEVSGPVSTSFSTAFYVSWLRKSNSKFGLVTFNDVDSTQFDAGFSGGAVGACATGSFVLLFESSGDVSGRSVRIASPLLSCESKKGDSRCPVRVWFVDQSAVVAMQMRFAQSGSSDLASG
jgi:hypothetical protein